MAGLSEEKQKERHLHKIGRVANESRERRKLLLVQGPASHGGLSKKRRVPADCCGRFSQPLQRAAVQARACPPRPPLASPAAHASTICCCCSNCCCASAGTATAASSAPSSPAAGRRRCCCPWCVKQMMAHVLRERHMRWPLSPAAGLPQRRACRSCRPAWLPLLQPGQMPRARRSCAKPSVAPPAPPPHRHTLTCCRTPRPSPRAGRWPGRR